jgi:hypothetical protein
MPFVLEKMPVRTTSSVSAYRYVENQYRDAAIRTLGIMNSRNQFCMSPPLDRAVKLAKRIGARKFRNSPPRANSTVRG